MDAIINCVVSPLWRWVQYHRKLDENTRNLKRKLEELNCRNEDIESRLQTECHPGKKRKVEVVNWLQNSKQINSEAREIEQNVQEVKYVSRARLGKRVLQMIDEVDKHHQSGGMFDALVIDAPPSTGVVLPTTTIVGETTTKKTTDEILEYLMGNEVMKIGVCGMGGAGKTTIMTGINNKLLKERNNFTNVIWITVSQPLDLTKLQDRIADALKRDLPNDDDKMIRAGKVSEMLEGKRFVLLLDDMWEAFDLEELGIPEPTKENGCKLVITTRSEEVCRFMDCKVINVKRLPEDEALELFLDKVGKTVISRRPDLEKTIKLVVDQCAGLPLAIVTVAGSMKGEEDICEWRNALAELSENIKNFRGMEAKITSKLKFSYDRLRDERVQRCFLYCALYPEDFKISKCELISYWIGEGLVDERNSMQALSDKCHGVLNRLVRNCLLESVVDDYGRGSVKMHDLIRDMALQITSQSPLFMVNARLKLEEFPGKQEWKGDLEKVSLMNNKISEIPSNFSPNCQKLSTLLLQGNPLRNIPEVFFLHMPNLRILDLSYTMIKDLPNSICELRCLTTLLLNNCWILQHVPSLAKLSSLWRLELGGTNISQVPAGMEMLEKLRYLDLYSRELGRLPTGVLPKLFRLQKLRTFFGSKTPPITIEEVTKLGKLEIFEGHFCNIKDFNQYVKYLESQSPTPQNYCLRLSSNDLNLGHVEYVNVNKHVELWRCNICEREDSIVVLEDVQRLQISYCYDLTRLSDIPLFNKLYKEGGRLNGNYSDLKVLHINCCQRLKKLFSPKLLPALENLEEIDVQSCYGMEVIIDGDVDELEENNGRSDTIIFTFPKLRKMTFSWLTELKSICSSNGVIVCDSLQQVVVDTCHELKRLPLSLPVLPAIKEIEVEREWWESLEWDDPNAKNDLEPYCRSVVWVVCTWYGCISLAMGSLYVDSGILFQHAFNWVKCKLRYCNSMDSKVS